MLNGKMKLFMRFCGRCLLITMGCFTLPTVYETLNWYRLRNWFCFEMIIYDYHLFVGFGIHHSLHEVSQKYCLADGWNISDIYEMENSAMSGKNENYFSQPLYHGWLHSYLSHISQHWFQSHCITNYKTLFFQHKFASLKKDTLFKSKV